MVVPLLLLLASTVAGIATLVLPGKSDLALLPAARNLGARVVSNDRFRDRAETYPEVLEPGHVLRGGYREGTLWLDLR